VCFEREEKQNLLRFVRTEEGLIRDDLQRLPGRGAYVHRREACLEQIGREKIWKRAFRFRGTRKKKATE
jgi:predicted RNA-binding protein YlxR (DUF448 family)